MRSCCLAQEAQLSALQWPRGVGGERGRLRREQTYVYLWLIPAVVQQKPTQKDSYTPGSLRELVKPSNKLVDASLKKCVIRWWFLQPFAFHLYEHLNRKEEKMATLQDSDIWTLWDIQFLHNLMHILTLQSCLTVIHVSLKKMHCMKRILATQKLWAAARSNNKWNTCAKTVYLALIYS